MKTSKPTRAEKRIRRAPKDGYAFEKKAQYRQQVWSPDALGKVASRITGPKDVVLIMPSSEGLEIETVIEAGIKPENIIACDMSREVFKNAEWPKRYPQIMKFVCDVGDVPARARRKGLNIVAANLDFCDAMGRNLYKSVKTFWHNLRKKDGFLLSMNILNARGSGEDNAILNRNYAFAEEAGWHKRIYAVLDTALVFDDLADVEILAQGKYSHKVPMAWCVIETHQDKSDSDEAVFERHARMKAKPSVSLADAINVAEVGFETPRAPRGEKVRRPVVGSRLKAYERLKARRSSVFA